MSAIADMLGTRRRPKAPALAGFVAISLHAAIALAIGRSEPKHTPVFAPTEVELAPSPEPPAPEKPVVPEPVHDAPQHTIAAAKPASAPAAAKAGRVITAAPAANTPKAEEPVSFVSDENGGTFGSGVVAKGGTAAVGAANATANGVVGSQGAAQVPVSIGGGGLVAASDLSRAPMLRDPGACKGFFPTTAQDDVASVSLMIVVQPTGKVSTASVIAESPKSQGFGAAARACLLANAFNPALDKEGRAVATSTKVNVRFSR
jgi:TonB family protein